MYDPRLDAITADLTALEAIVRALARTWARRSRTALADLLDSCPPRPTASARHPPSAASIGGASAASSTLGSKT